MNTIFTLPNLDVSYLHEKYSLQQKTYINDLDTSINVSYLDEARSNKSCKVVMVDINNMNDSSCNNTDCFWCCHSFSHMAIGCPIKYISNSAVKTYYSEISKDIYSIREDITPNRFKILDENNKDKRLKIIKNGYYECDGCFCSFNCCQAFINENIHNIMYKSSRQLLLRLHKNIYNTKIDSIQPAPHWRLLKKYGGILDIESFRNDFVKVEYEYKGIVKNIFKPIGTIWEEQLKFN